MSKVKIRNLPWIIISILMISTMFYSATTIRPVSALTGATLLVEPPSATITGTQFALNVSIANITGLAGLQFTLNWTAGVVSCLTLNENLFATVTPATHQDNIWKLTLKKDNQSVMYAYTYQDLVAAQADGYCPINITGEVAAALMTFNVTQIPAVGSYIDVPFEITVAKPGDLLGVKIPCLIQNSTIRIMGPSPVQTIVHDITFNGTHYNVTTVTNETVIQGSAAFVATPNPTLSFNVSGPDGDTAYVNVTIPMDLMNSPEGNWTVNVNGTSVTPIITNDTTYTYVYFTAPLSNELVTIIVPEFTLLFIPLLMATTLLAVALRRRKRF